MYRNTHNQLIKNGIPLTISNSMPLAESYLYHNGIDFHYSIIIEKFNELFSPPSASVVVQFTPKFGNNY